MILNRTET
jgi:hypothetical protein